LNPSKPITSQTPGVYVWEIPNKQVSVHLSLDVVDRMQQDVMRGFGAVPKRGAEVGGILLGTVQSGPGTVVTIDDYIAVPTEYKRGPSYLLSDEDSEVFDAAMVKARNSRDTSVRPVGLYRSHTRDGVGLGAEDIALADEYFPEPSAIILVIKPFATKVSQAGFYFRDEGRLTPLEQPLLEFPFRRRELEPLSHPAAPRAPERPERVERPERPERPERRPIVSEQKEPEPQLASQPAPPAPAPAPPPPREIPRSREPAFIPAQPPPVAPDVVFTERPSKARKGWVWIPLSFIFLILGVLLGVQLTLTMRPKVSPGGDPYRLNLTITPDADSLRVTWDRQSPAIQAADSGLLTIDDGASAKMVNLQPRELRNGSVVASHTTSTVRFRLEVFLKNHVSVSQMEEWKQQP